MRKKFVTVALLGALALTSTHFVGCKDYDDDISRLQEQVDALKSISISDLASQLQSLKDANGNLTLASAKMEAAIAEIKTNIEALKEADKTLTSLVNGKVDQATYKAAIDALNAKCSDLSAKVAALSALETAVNDLKANKADKATMDALQAAVKALEAKDTEFATQLASLKSTVEGMNSVLAGKVDKATADALKESIDALKVSVNGIDSKVSKALEPIQASIAKLQEDLANKANAATIAADIAKVKSEMTSVTDALKLETASNLAGVKAELAGRIAALETAKGQMEVQIGKLQSDLGALKDRVTALENKPTTDINEVKAAIAANKTAIESAQTTIGSIQGTINGITSRLDGIGVEVGAVKNYIDSAILTLSSTISLQITTSIGAAVSRLESEYKQADTHLAARIAALEGLEHVDKTEFANLKDDFNNLKKTIGDAENGLVKQLSDLDTKVSNLISEAIDATGPGSIAAAITKQISAALKDSEVIKTAIAEAISDLTGRVDKIDAALEAVLQRIQSIVFVPQYKDANGTSIVPVYAINNANGTVEMTFRISPVDKATELAALGATKPEIFSFYKEDELQSRATSETALRAVEVSAGVNAGTIVIKAQVNLAANTSGSFYPVALKLSTTPKDHGTAETSDNKTVNDVTTEYFNVRVTDINVPGCTVEQPSIEIVYTNTQEQLVNSNVVNVTSNLTLADCGFTQNLQLYSINCNGNWVELSSTVQGDKDAIAAELQAKGFELVGKTAVKLSSPININHVGNVLQVKLADNKNLFGLTGNPAKPVKTFGVTYTVTKNIVGATIDYAAITKASLQTGSTTDNFDVDDKAPELFVWKNSASNGTQTFIIKAEKAAKFTDQLIDGATGAEILAAIKALAPAKITHKIGNVTATAADPTFNFDVDNDKVTVNLPAGKFYETYAMSTVYETATYGNIVLKATLKLAYPTADKLWKREEVRWANSTTYFLEYTPVGTNYDINDELSAGYNYKMKDAGVSYNYELVKTIDANRDGVMDAVPDGVTITPAGKIVFTKDVDLQLVRVRLAAKFANNVGRQEEFSIQMTYPITDKIASKSYTYTKAAMLANTPLDIIKGFYLNDRFSATNKVVEDGKILTLGSTTYRMTTGTAPTLTDGIVFPVTSGIRYTVKDGKVEGSTQTVSAREYFNIDSDGKFSLKKNINLAKKVTIEVQAAVDYTYGTKKSDVFTITLEPTL